MAETVRIHSKFDLRGLQQDLESVELGLGPLVGRAVRGVADLVAGGTAIFTPFDPNHDPKRKDAEPHLNQTIGTATLAAHAAAVTTSHPGGPVHEWGGTIAPKGTPITIRQSFMAHKAFEQLGDFPERDLARRIDQLMLEHHL